MADSADRITVLEHRIKRLQLGIAVVALCALGALGLAIATTFVLKPAAPTELVFADGNRRTQISASGITIRGETGAFGAGPGSMTLEDVNFGTVHAGLGGIGISNKDALLTMSIKGGEPTISGTAGQDMTFRLEASTRGSQLGLRSKGGNAIHLHTDAASYPLSVRYGDKSITLPVAEPSTK